MRMLLFFVKWTGRLSRKTNGTMPEGYRNDIVAPPRGGGMEIINARGVHCF